jgi:Na+/H+ antiporter NhaD/arsenite permease-like protein
MRRTKSKDPGAAGLKPTAYSAIHTTSLRTLSSFFTASGDVINFGDLMHTKLPFVTALALVLAPSLICLLFGVLCHSFFKRRSLKQREDPTVRVPPPSHRRDDFRAILFVFATAALAFAISAAA